MSIKAFHYGRVSSVGQVKGHGLDRQREIAEAYAKANGIEIAAVYADAHTGTESDRPQFIEMLDALMSNGVRTVIIESLDRLARDVMIQCTLLAKLESLGITLISASTGEDVTASMRDDPMREALVIIQGVFAQLDKKLLVRKLRKGREATKAAKGRCEGQKPYGTLPGEQEVIERIKTLKRKPKDGKRPSFADIAERLNAESVPTRNGKPWNRGTVWKICKDM